MYWAECLTPCPGNMFAVCRTITLFTTPVPGFKWSRSLSKLPQHSTSVRRQKIPVARVKRSASVPYSAMVWTGSTTLPRDLLIFRPSPSLTCNHKGHEAALVGSANVVGCANVVSERQPHERTTLPCIACKELSTFIGQQEAKLHASMVEVKW